MGAAQNIVDAYNDDDRPWVRCPHCYYERPIGIPCGEPCV